MLYSCTTKEPLRSSPHLQVGVVTIGSRIIHLPHPTWNLHTVFGFFSRVLFYFLRVHHQSKLTPTIMVTWNLKLTFNNKKASFKPFPRRRRPDHCILFIASWNTLASRPVRKEWTIEEYIYSDGFPPQRSELYSDQVAEHNGGLGVKRNPPNMICILFQEIGGQIFLELLVVSKMFNMFSIFPIGEDIQVWLISKWAETT